MKVPEALVPHWDIVKGASRRSAAVYLDKHLIPERECFRNDFDETQVFLARGTCVAVSWSDERIEVTARGTNPKNKTAVRNDYLAVLAEENYLGSIHLGGRTELDHVWSRVSGLIGELCEEKHRRIYCVGHSLGGLMAEIAYARLAVAAVSSCMKCLPFGLITFGKPLGGDARFCSWVETISDLHRMRESGDEDCRAMGHVRFVNGTDFVTRVPSPWVPGFQRYRQSGVPFRFIGDCLKRDPYRVRVFSHWLGQRLSRHPISASFRDHSMSTYLEKIEKLQVSE